MTVRRGNGFLLLVIMTTLLCLAGIGHAEEQSTEASQEQQDVQQLDDVVVEEKGGAPGLEVKPSETVIDVESFSTIAAPDSILDVLKTHAMVDFRGESDFDPGVDSIYVRGFDSARFVTAIDNLTIQKSGGRKSSNVVDYATLPAFLIEKVELLPGPHSALFDSKSIGGVLNFVTRMPERRDTLKPEAKMSASYSSYGTWNGNASLQGAVNAFTYDFGYQHSHTDGYLRNTEMENDTLFGRIGIVLPGDGFAALTASHSDIKRGATVNNNSVDGDYDSDYPTTEDASFDPDEEPTWDTVSSSYRFNYEQSLPIGRLEVGAFYGRDNRNRSYLVDGVRSDGTTNWWQEGGKIQDEISWNSNHSSTIGFDLATLYDEGTTDEKTRRIKKEGIFLQHQWAVLPSVDVRLGVRHEDVRIWVTNSRISYLDDVIERHWNELVPKSFTTWKMDRLAAWLRDTSLSVGVSKIWHAPDYHGHYNPQGRPAGAWLEPEHGIGYDLVLDRRLWRDISLQINYAFYDIEDYIVHNRTYSTQEDYKDYVINLERVHRHGVDISLGGHILDPVSFYLTYAWQTFDSQGDEMAGDTELDKRAEHRVNAGLRYDLFEKTTLMLDYYFQSEETTQNWVENPPESEDYDYFEEQNDAYHVFDLGVQQKLFKKAGWFENGTMKVWIKNLLDEEYYNSSGYPATDRTYGVSFRFGL